MKILDRYIAKQIISMILLVSLLLLGVDLFFILANEVKVLGKGGYSLNVLLQFILLSVPTRLYIMFPWAALIGSLIALGRLANYRELVVMRSAGVSVFRITWSVIKAALTLILVAVLIGEGIAPAAERFAQYSRTKALTNGQTLQTQYGVWIRQGEGFIHIKNVMGKGELQGITRYLFSKDQKLQEALYADRALQVGKDWHLMNVKGSRFLDKKTTTFQEKTMRLPRLLSNDILESALVKHLDRLSIISLWRAIHQRTKNELNTEAYVFAFWSKMFQPLVIIMMVFLAVPFVFGPLRSVSPGFRIVAGICVGFLFHIINNLSAPLAVVYQFPPLIAVMLPILVFSGVGAWFLRRTP